jgi:CheY-like chemotaxis protein/HPt (histidine-containing phosphotransfer) domain-containing protein
VGKGSTFSVVWTAEIAEALDRDSAEIRVGVRVLAVEDHEASARALEAIAATLAAQITVARSIAEATALAKTIEEPQVVLVDSTLRAVTVSAAAEALRAIPVIRRLPLVSAIAPSAERMRVGVEPPFVATTLKPYRASRLAALLNDVLSPRPAAPTPVMLSPWRPLDVLVVDDDSTNRLVATLLLERAGLRPHAAGSGEEALALIDERRFDVILLDLHMEGIDGLETARRIRAERDPGGRLWIVALTASVYDEDRQRCLDAGMDDFIAKPIEIGLFRAALERAQRAVRRRTGSSSSIIPIAPDGVHIAIVDSLFQALGKDKNELALLIDDYTRASAEHCALLRSAVSRKDAKEASRAAHSLASSSGQLGAHRVEKLARTIERDADGGTLPNEQAIDLVHRERETAVMRLHEWLGGLI